MCGGSSSPPPPQPLAPVQQVEQRTDLDPMLTRLLYGGAMPRGGSQRTQAPAPTSSGTGTWFGNPDVQRRMAAQQRQQETIARAGFDPRVGPGSMDPNTQIQQYTPHFVGDPARTPSGGASRPSAYDQQMAAYERSGGGISVGYGSTPRSALRDAGYAMGGSVQTGIASMQPNMPMMQSMPMMNGALPNLSDREIAATMAMAAMRPQMMMGGQGFAAGGYVEGPGTGTSDDIPATIYQDGVPVQNAALSDGEFVMTERAVRNAGGGDRDRGAAKMYEMMRMFEQGGRV